jgi:hypothetical protein
VEGRDWLTEIQLNLTPKEAERLRKVGDARRRRAGGTTNRSDPPSKGVDDGVTKAAEVDVLEVEKVPELEAAR